MPLVQPSSSAAPHLRLVESPIRRSRSRTLRRCADASLPATVSSTRRFLFLVAIALAVAAPAAADDAGVTGQVRPGSLSLARVAVHGGSASLVVRDGRGSGAGWRLTMTRADPAEIRIRCAAASTCTLPRPVPSRADGTIVIARHGGGMGSVQVLVSLRSQSARPVFRLLAGGRRR